MAARSRGRAGAAPTIYDVARESGVAPSTVSRAFARPGRVNAETAARIRAVADRLGYRTNPLARALPTGKTGVVAMVVADITNPVNFPLIRGAEAAAAAAGYLLVLADAQESAPTERAAIERVVPSVEGLVLSSSRMSDSAIRMAVKQRPTVVVNRGIGEAPCVIVDNARGMRRLVEHLGELGHDKLTYVAGPEASWTDGMRWRAVREACLELDLRARRIGPHPPTIAGGLAAVADLRDSLTTAVLAYNDLLAIGLIRGLGAAGVRVPHDVSVTGFDDIFAADFVTPALTTVAAPLQRMGATAVQHLAALLRGVAPRQGTPVVLPVQLVVRSSTAQRSRKRTSPASGTTRVSGSADHSSTSTVAGSR